MKTIFLLLAILAAILFPVFLVRAEEKVEAANYTADASICLGYLTFVMVAG